MKEQPKTVIKLEVFSDPGHSWAKVPAIEILDLGIAKKISQYSYHKAPFVYLEEDCDLEIYIEALKSKHGEIELEFKHNDTNYDSVIRSFPRYSAGRI